MSSAPVPDFVALIPARLASTRLPDKPLADIGGKPMVVRVVERAIASGARLVAVATDSERIAQAVRQEGYTAIITREDHASGTDRLAEAAMKLRESGSGPFGYLSLLELEPRTGRTHQLRIQCAERGLPIVGDRTYGDFQRNRAFADKKGEAVMFLHAERVALTIFGGPFDVYLPAGKHFSLS